VRLAGLALSSFAMLAQQEALVEQLLLLVATHITHSHQAALTQDKK